MKSKTKIPRFDEKCCRKTRILAFRLPGNRYLFLQNPRFLQKPVVDLEGREKKNKRKKKREKKRKIETETKQRNRGKKLVEEF